MNLQLGIPWKRGKFNYQLNHNDKPMLYIISFCQGTFSYGATEPSETLGCLLNFTSRWGAWLLIVNSEYGFAIAHFSGTYRWKQNGRNGSILSIKIMRTNRW